MSVPFGKPFWNAARASGIRNEHLSADKLVVSDKFPVADGIVFDDTLGFSRRQVQLLKARRVLFITRFRDEEADRWFGGIIIATDIDAAKVVAFGRGLGEEVVGELE